MDNLLVPNFFHGKYFSNFSSIVTFKLPCPSNLMDIRCCVVYFTKVVWIQIYYQTMI